jgi:hypothetical protein
MERGMVSRTIGSVNDPKEALQMGIAWRKERAQLDQELGKAFNDYRNQNGDYASPGKFMRNEGQRIIENHNARLAKILKINPSELEGNSAYQSGGAGGQNKVPVQDLIERYRTPKKGQ